MNRVARACGGNVVHRTEELKEADVGTGCGLYEVSVSTCTVKFRFLGFTGVRIIVLWLYGHLGFFDFRGMGYLLSMTMYILILIADQEIRRRILHVPH